MELKLESSRRRRARTNAAQQASTEAVRSFERRPSRRPFPDHLPRERVVIAAPQTCPCCGSARLSKLGEDITETLEVIPRRWKVIQTVRERFSCRDCETITQPPAPFHVTPRGFAGPNLLATILFEKFGQHQPLNRQSERYGREGIDLSVSTLADQVGACATALRPLYGLIEAHVLSAQRLHGDDTTVPILAKGKTVTGRIWTYVRDDRPLAAGRRRPPSTMRRATAPVPIPSVTFTASRHPAGRCLQRLQPALRRRPSAGRDHAGILLGACTPAVLRARRHRRQSAARQERRRDLADRA